MGISGHHRHRFLSEMESSLPPSHHGNTTGDLDSYQTYMDSNMVIVLAVLLCAIVVALGLNSIVRFALRCGHRFSQEREEAATSRQTATEGLKKSSLIGQFPEVTYRSGLHILVTDCLICLGEFADGEKLRVLPKCNHAFHVKCIDKWLWSNISCPLCRRRLLDESTSRSAEAEEVNVTVQLSVNSN